MLATKISILSVGLAIWSLPVSALAASFSQIIVFGDSISDSGNAAIVTAPNFQTVPFGALIPSLPYQSGRLTNGPVWVEKLAQSFGLGALPSLAGGTNFAFASAGTGPLGTVPPTAPSLLDQFAAFQFRTGGVADSDALYVVYGGSNNLLFDAALRKQAGDDAGATATISQAVNDLSTIIGGLGASGAVNIVVPNMPNLGQLPLSLRGTPGLDTASTAVSVEFNTLLSSSLSGFRNNPNLNLIEIDTFSFISSLIASPGSFGFTNGTDPCVDLTSVCSNPDEYVFYDGIHPTAATYEKFAQFVTGQITSVPEPSGLLGLGLGLGLVLLSTKRDKTF